MKLNNILLVLFVFLLVPGVSGVQASGTITVGSSAGASSTTIQSAYNTAAVNGGGIIEVEAGTYPETLSFSKSVSVALTGGYDTLFSIDSSNSTIAGTLTISNGTVTVQNIIISSPPTLVSIAVTPANSGIPLGTTQQFTATGT